MSFLSSSATRAVAAAAEGAADQSQLLYMVHEHDDHHLLPTTPGSYPSSPPAVAASPTILVSEGTFDKLEPLSVSVSTPDVHSDSTTELQRQTSKSNEVIIPSSHPSSPRSHSLPTPRGARRKSLPASPATLLRRRALEKSADEQHQQQQAVKTLPSSAMRRRGKTANEDLFLELANDEVAEPSPPRRHERAPSRASLVAKHRSLPPPASDSSHDDNRPLTSGHTNARRPVSRFNQPSFDALYSTSPSRDALVDEAAQAHDQIGASRLSTASRAQNYTDMQDRAGGAHSRLTQRIRSPERLKLTQRRLSMASSSPEAHKTHRRLASSRLHDLPIIPSPHESDRKPSLPDSASVESDGADSTVWDEIDDLKSRIKKIELTGKMPTNPSATASAEQSERPRTATTAPTTIDSSPKHEKPSEKTSWTGAIASDSTSTLVAAASNLSKIHPMLHEALARAKKLLSPSLFRQLDDTASEALHLAAMLGSSGSQGAAALGTAPLVHRASANERQMRRKADNMCRNLTDVIVSLCEGKHETPPNTMMSSPAGGSDMHTPTGISPGLRFQRSVSRQNSVNRPMSRLEARRSSILGTTSRGISLEYAEDQSGPEQEEATPSQRTTSTHGLRTDPRRFSYYSAAPSASSRLHQAAHMPRYEAYEPASDDDYDDTNAAHTIHTNANTINPIISKISRSNSNTNEDPTIRPLSRARTEIGGSTFPRLTPGYQHQLHHQHQQPQVAHRSPSLRESLAARRAIAAAGESHYNVPTVDHRLSRVASVSGARATAATTTVRGSIADESALMPGDDERSRLRSENFARGDDDNDDDEVDDDGAKSDDGATGDTTTRASEISRNLPAFHQRRGVSVRGGVGSGSVSALGSRFSAAVEDEVVGPSRGGGRDGGPGRKGSFSSRRKRAAS